MANPFSGRNEKLNSVDKKQYLDNLFEEYHNLDFEDVIGGGTVKTRFKYTSVKPDDFGLNDDEILLLDDKQLNQLVSLKNYRPFKNVEEEAAPADGEEPSRERKQKKQGVNVHAVINKKKEFRKELNDKLEMVRQVEQAQLEAEKSKLLKTKKKDEKKHGKKDKLLKKRKHKDNEDRPEEGEGVEQELDVGAASKRKRMALYGV